MIKKENRNYLINDTVKRIKVTHKFVYNPFLNKMSKDGKSKVKEHLKEFKKQIEESNDLISQVRVCLEFQILIGIDLITCVFTGMNKDIWALTILKKIAEIQSYEDFIEIVKECNEHLINYPKFNTSIEKALFYLRHEKFLDYFDTVLSTYMTLVVLELFEKEVILIPHKEEFIQRLLFLKDEEERKTFVLSQTEKFTSELAKHRELKEKTN